jgi:hypothetical protein
MSATLDDNARLSADRLLADLPPRVARIESDVEYIKRDIGELKTGVAALRAEVTGEFKAVRAESLALREAMHGEFRAVRAESLALHEAVHGEFRAVRAEMRTDFRLLFAAVIVVALGLAGLLAKAFRWIA